jgi:hypothetical protein
MLSNPCFEGWNDIEHNREGACCCNCEWQRPIVGHPRNKNILTKGPITQCIGYGCTCPELYPSITFTDWKHSMCECHTERDYSKYSKDYLMDILKNEKT